MRNKRFVKHFYSYYGDDAVEELITDYAEQNDLKIITISCMYQNGIYVLFEEISEGLDDERDFI